MKKKIIGDAFLNIVATTLPIILLQLIIFPVLANKLGNAQYGLFVTFVSLFTVVSHPFGDALNHVRLLENSNYERRNIKGDFNLLVIASLIINSIIMFFGVNYYEKNITFISIVLIIVISCLNLLRVYLIVAFRITLKYRDIFINNLFIVAGYVVGFICFFVTDYWQFIYILGYLFSIIHVKRNSNIMREKLIITPYFKLTTYKSFVLYISGLLKSSLAYADRLLLFPLLGPKAVSVYYSATIIGKIITMGVGPVSSVILSYLTKIEEIKRKSFYYLLAITSILGVAGYFICILISYPMLEILYPNWAEESMSLIYITTASSIFGVMSVVIHPLILRFKSINWQMVIGGINFIVYIISALLFYKLYGLIGFCIGILIANIVKFLLMIFVFLSNKNSKDNKFRG